MYTRQDEETSASELYGKVAPWVVIVLVVVVGWLVRDPLTARFTVTVNKARPGTLPAQGPAWSFPGAQAPETPATPATPAAPPRKDTVYRWVDRDGVTHYEQQGGRGREAVEVDQGRINALNDYKAPVPATPGK